MLARLLGLLLATAASAVCAQDRIEMFYLGARDCFYCQHWEARARQELLASPEGRAIRYVEIQGETLREPIVARHFPPEHRWVYEQIGPSRGVPRFILAIDGRVTLSALGTGGYNEIFLPALRAAVANRAAATRRAHVHQGGVHAQARAS